MVLWLEEADYGSIVMVSDEDTMVAYIFASSSCGLGMNSSWGMQLYNAHGESTQSPECEDCVDSP